MPLETSEAILESRKWYLKYFAKIFSSGAPDYTERFNRVWCETQNPATELKTISRARHYKHQQGNSSRCSEYFRSFIVENINMRGRKTHKFPKWAKFNVPIMQERPKNHITNYQKSNQRRITNDESHKNPPVMISRMRSLSCNGSIQSTFKNPPF